LFLIDFSKAFDVLHQSIFGSILAQLNIPGAQFYIGFHPFWLTGLSELH